MNKKLENFLIYNSIPFKKKESKWYNSHAYLPLIEIQIVEENNELNVFHNFEFRISEFSKPTFINYNDNLTSRIRVQSEFTIKNKSLPEFKIEKSSYFINLFKSNSSFKIKTKNSSFKNFLDNEEIKSFFEMFKSDPEFDPIIKGINSNGTFKIGFNFQCKNIDGMYLEIINRIISNINHYS